jgi:hypothetical protein
MKALKLFLAVISILACIAAVSIFMLTILYSIEKPRQKLNQTQQGMYNEYLTEDNNRVKISIVNSDFKQQQ